MTWVTCQTVPRDSSLDSRVPRAAFLTPQWFEEKLKVSLALERRHTLSSLVEGLGQGCLCPLDASVSSPTRCPFVSLYTRIHSTYLSSVVPPGWAGHGSSDVVITLLREGPGWGGPSSSARSTPHGCLQAGDTSSGCPSPEQSSRCCRVPEWQPAGGSPTSTMPRWLQKVR